MEQYSNFLTSPEYREFIAENADYADICGYHVRTVRGMNEAVADQFLFQQFLDEQHMAVE